MIEIIFKGIHYLVHYLLPIACILSLYVYIRYKPIAEQRNLRDSHLYGFGMNMLVLFLCTAIEYRSWLHLDIENWGAAFRYACDPVFLLLATMGPVSYIYLHPAHYNDSITASRIRKMTHTDLYIRMAVFLVLALLMSIKTDFRYFSMLKRIFFDNNYVLLDCVYFLLPLFFFFIFTFYPTLCSIYGEKCKHCNYYADHPTIYEDEVVTKANAKSTTTHKTTIYKCVKCGKTFVRETENSKTEIDVIYVC